MASPKVPAPDNLTRDERIELLGWIQGRAHPSSGVPNKFFLEYARHRELIRTSVDCCLDYHRAKGNKFIDWVAACRTWIGNDYKRWLERQISSEKPQQDVRRRSSKGLQPLTDTIEMFTKGEK